MPIRLGDDVDDFCPKCKRLTNHNVVSLTGDRPAKVRCRSCYHEQDFRDGVPPPSKRDLAKASLFGQVLESLKPGASAPAEAAPEAAPKKTAKKRG
jgi:hypothetical protein